MVLRGISPKAGLQGRTSLPGDKSIAHRAIILSAISSGQTTIRNLPANNDCRSTIEAFLKLGIKIKTGKSGRAVVFGRGLSGLVKPGRSLRIGESGTTFRLLLGILAAQKFAVRLTAGRSLARRPMLRVIVPLRKMGAVIKSKIKCKRSKTDEYPPLVIKGGNLKGITYKMPVASAQVKSAILLAGLCADGQTKVIEPVKTRDHTERMLKIFKSGVKVKGNTVVIKGKSRLISPGKVYIPGDISSAAFFMVAASIVPASRVFIENVGLNPSRMGVVKVLKRMGAKIRVSGVGVQAPGGEPMGDVVVKSGSLKAATVKRAEIPSLIDELPVLMVAASLAQGKTVFKGVGELRVKETDRIRSMSENLRKMGADIKVVKSGKSEDIIIQGVPRLKGASLKSFGDHRTAMGVIVAALAAKGRSSIDEVSCINKSFPGFLSILKGLT